MSTKGEVKEPWHPGRKQALLICLLVCLISAGNHIISRLADLSEGAFSYSFWRTFLLCQLSYLVVRGDRRAYWAMRLLLIALVLEVYLPIREQVSDAQRAFHLLTFGPALIGLARAPQIRACFGVEETLKKWKEAPKPASTRAAKPTGPRFAQLPSAIPLYLRARSLREDVLVLPTRDALDALSYAEQGGLVPRFLSGHACEADGRLLTGFPKPAWSPIPEESGLAAAHAFARELIQNTDARWHARHPGSQAQPAFALHFRDA
jgi:hypothetical protein